MPRRSALCQPNLQSTLCMYIHTSMGGMLSYCCAPLPAEGPREGNQATLLGTHKLHAVLTSGPAFHLLCFIFFLLLPQSANLTISGSGEPAHMSWERKGSITVMIQIRVPRSRASMLLHSSSFASFVCTLPCLSHIPLLPPVFAILCLEATNFQMLLMVSQEKECTFSCCSVCVCNGVLCVVAAYVV